MSYTNNTPYMSLSLPVPMVELSPAWAIELNAALTLVDSHNHSNGQGVQVPTAGLNINADLTFAGYNATNLRAVKMGNQSSALAGVADVGCLYVSGGDLYYNSSSGQQVHITSGAALNLSSAGSISGLSGTNAALTYASINQTFTFTQNSGITASIASGPISISANTSGAPAVTLQTSGSLAAAYNITLPLATPASTSLMTMDPSGNLATQTVLTRPQLPAVGPQISASSGSFSTSSSSLTAVTNLSVTITTTGRPVHVFLQPDGGYSSRIQAYGSGGSYPLTTIYVALYNGGTSIANIQLTNEPSGSNYTLESVDYPPSTLMVLDTPAAGTCTYTVYVSTNGFSGAQARVYNCKLVAYEL